MLCDISHRMNTATIIRKSPSDRRAIPTTGRGLLSNWPPDVVAVINGRPITTGDILRGKRERQAAGLASIRRDDETASKPCFVWTFHNDGWVYGGWWLYVRTTRRHWQLTLGGGRRDHDLILSIMALFPCNYLPMPCFFRDWKAAFAGHYPYPTAKRPRQQGMAMARAIIGHGGNGNLLAVERMGGAK